MLARLTIQAEIIVPLFLHGLCAGFPSPADDFMDETIDLTRLLVTNPPATFFMPAYDVPDIAEVEIWGVAKCNVHWLRMPASKR